MAKRGKVVKRVYEEGREKTIFSAKKRSLARKKTLSGKSRLNIDTPELPSSYSSTRLTLLAKDPLWIYAYWEITQDSLLSLRDNIPTNEVDNGKIVLRMYDVTLKNFDGSNANSFFDIEVGHDANNWYINLWNDDVSYIGDLGLRTPDGKFYTIARSNHVHTPRVSHSPRTEEMWMKVTAESPSRPYVHYRVEDVKPDESLAQREAAMKKEEKPVARLSDRRLFYINEEEIRQYYGKLSPLLHDIISARLAKLLGKAPGKFAFMLEGAAPSALPKDHLMKKLLLGSSQELVLGASESLAEGPGGASEFVHENIKERRFFFEIATELIVYGRTGPDAEVWLGDKKVSLKKDGTFSMRLSLPDGKIPLEFTAIPADKKEKRKISTRVERTTDQAG